MEISLQSLYGSPISFTSAPALLPGLVAQLELPYCPTLLSGLLNNSQGLSSLLQNGLALPGDAVSAVAGPRRRLPAGCGQVAGPGGQPQSCSEGTADPADKARQKGFSEEEVQAATEKVQKALQSNDDDQVVALSEDDLCMLVATPDEKSKMIKQLMDGYTSDKDDRAIVSILQSVEDRQEFDQIIDGAGGRKVGEELDDDEAKKKFDRLVGGYDRMDLALNKQEAEKTRGVLLDPAHQERLLGGADSDTAFAEDSLATGDRAEDFQRAQTGRTAAKVATLDRRTVVETVCENSVREKEGKPLINPREIRGQVNEIMNDESLTPEQREEKIKQIQKQNGLSEYTMRNIATQPVARIYERAKIEAARFAQQEVAQLKHELASIEKIFGKGSPEAAEAQAKLSRFEAKMAPYLKKLDGVAGALNDMFPPPKSFWESLGGFLGGLFKAIVPALLNLIPGVGTALYAGYTAINAIVQGAQGNLLGMVSGLAGAIPGVGSLVGGATQKLLDVGSKIVRGGIGLGQAISEGNPLGALGAATGLAGDLGAPSIVSEVAGYTNKGAGLVQGLASGNPLGALNSAVGLAGDLGAPAAVTGYAARGLEVAGGLAAGNPLGALNGAVGLAGDLGAPAAVTGYATRGLEVAGGLVTGSGVRLAADLLPAELRHAYGYASRVSQIADSVAFGNPTELRSVWPWTAPLSLVA